jgi:hypothetical protein
MRLLVIGVQPDWHPRCINAANGTSCWKVNGRLLDEIGRMSCVLERLLRVELGQSASGHDHYVAIDGFQVKDHFHCSAASRRRNVIARDCEQPR